MATYLLTWNPDRWPWADLPDAADEVAERGRHVEPWSCGNTKRIRPGDRLFLLMQGRRWRGIIASGFATTEPFEGEHWDPSKSTPALYVTVAFDAIQNPATDPYFHREWLNAPAFADVYWNTQSSGIFIPPHVAQALGAAWEAFLATGQPPPAESRVGELRLLYEGSAHSVTLTSYERNPEARRQCLAHYGPRCAVCTMDFGHRYGPAAEGLIHVHHLDPLSELEGAHVVNPIADLRPVCPNCHAVIHRRTPPYTIEEVRAMLRPA